ncbi:MAG TPA: ABC transporter ATP-binding protein [Candidatus Dormibacteraeota bacterium]|nr:ABC transporter ATP-binding protein [Candidatus Dormibacteraeota bacterium]
MALFEIAGLESGYGGQHIVKGVTLNVGRGEVVALIGPNGAGKSTLLTTVVGLLKPRAGTVTLNGRDITGIDPERTLAAGLAYVPQVGNIFPSLSVLETLRVCYRRESFSSALREMLELFPRLETRLHARAGLLSGGERQMLAIARALINRPFDLIAMDEPSAALSVDNLKAIFERIDWIRRAGISVLLVEQNAVQALRICDRAYVMEGGRIVLEGTGAELLSSSAVREHYLGIR